MPFSFRPIESKDDPAIASIIRTVMPEFGADGPGFAIHDAEVDRMSAAYSLHGAAYFVVIDAQDRVVGGGGIAKLEGGPEGVCELRKMYFLPAARGTGMGEALLRHCLARAKELGYDRCYLETLKGMDAAQKLYRKLGFQALCEPLGATGHHGCDRWFMLELKDRSGV
jgi:putative acetyltransferase